MVGPVCEVSVWVEVDVGRKVLEIEPGWSLLLHAATRKRAVMPTVAKVSARNPSFGEFNINSSERNGFG